MSPMYILLVEDDENARRGLEVLLQQEGHRTCWASTGEGALELLRTEKDLGLVLLDIMLKPGGMDGVDVALHKMQDPRTAAIPVIVMSAVDPHEIRRKAQTQLDALATAKIIMGKPLDFNLLLKTINSMKP